MEQYHAIEDLFDSYLWNKMVYYCKPFNKMGNSPGSHDYDDLINKPSYILKEKDREKEVMLNGQIKMNVRPLYDQNGELIDEFKLKTTRLCLKAIHVAPLTAYEAIKSTQQISKPALKIGKRNFNQFDIENNPTSESI